MYLFAGFALQNFEIQDNVVLLIIEIIQTFLFNIDKSSGMEKSKWDIMYYSKAKWKKFNLELNP